VIRLRKEKLNLLGIFIMTVALLISGQAAGAMSIPVVSSGEIPNLSSFVRYNQSADINGTINLQGPTPNVVHLSGYFGHMNDFSNVFYVQAENRGFTTTVSSGGSGGGDGGNGGGM
jgi:hypothetical protein